MKSVKTDDAPAAVGPYSQAVVHDGMVYVSGQIPIDPSTGTVVEGIRDQASQVFTNLRNILEASGSSMDRVLKVTVFLSDISTFATVNEVYAEFFQEPYPSRSCVEVSALPKGVGIEVDAIAFTD